MNLSWIYDSSFFLSACLSLVAMDIEHVFISRIWQPNIIDLTHYECMHEKEKCIPFPCPQKICRNPCTQPELDICHALLRKTPTETSRYNITMMFEGFQGHSLNWTPMMPRGASLSGDCTPDGCSFWSPAAYPTAAQDVKETREREMRCARGNNLEWV